MGHTSPVFSNATLGGHVFNAPALSAGCCKPLLTRVVNFDGSSRNRGPGPSSLVGPGLVDGILNCGDPEILFLGLRQRNLRVRLCGAGCVSDFPSSLIGIRVTVLQTA